MKRLAEPPENIRMRHREIARTEPISSLKHFRSALLSACRRVPVGYAPVGVPVRVKLALRRAWSAALKRKHIEYILTFAGLIYNGKSKKSV